MIPWLALLLLTLVGGTWIQGPGGTGVPGPGTVTNAMLANPSMTVNSSTCTLGSSCAAAALSILNSMLANPATTVNGQTCTLGSTCTVAASAGALQSGIVNRTSGNISKSTTGLTDVTGATVTFTTNGATQVLIGFTSTVAVGANGFCYLNIVVDGVVQNGTFGIEVDSTLGESHPVGLTFLTPVLSNAAHTFKMQYAADGSNACTIVAIANNAMHFHAKEVY